MLSLKNVTKVFNSDLLNTPFVALRDVSFDIPASTMVGFLGANGAGKTTLLKIILGFIKACAGEVVFDKCLGKSREEIFRNIGFLPERPYYYPHLTGTEFAHFMGELSGLSRVEIVDELPRLAAMFRLDHAMQRELRTYSKGMLQRIGFLVTILHRPQLVLLDEPLSGLDPVGRKELKDIMRDVRREGRTIFFSTHIVSDVEEICDRVVFLKQGELQYDGPVQPLLAEHMKPVWRIVLKGLGDLKLADILSQRQLAEGLVELEVSVSHKDKVVKTIVEAGGSIVSLEQAKVRLEEIFYQTESARE